MSTLFSPYAIGPLTLKNRIVIAPMCQYCAVDGGATDWHMIHLGHLALSGAGLLIIEATAVEADRADHAADAWAVFGRQRGRAEARAGGGARAFDDRPSPCRLAHAGRKASSHVPWEGGQLIPLRAGRLVSLSRRRHCRMPKVRRRRRRSTAPGWTHRAPRFVAAARRAHRLGLAGHRAARRAWLPAAPVPVADLQPAQRSTIGGSLENRMRFPLAVFDAVRAAVPQAMPVGMRISGHRLGRRRLGCRAERGLRASA